MGRALHIAVALIMVAMVTACANSSDKWSKEESQAKETSMNSDANWQKDESSDTTKKASSSYWKEESRY